MSLILDALRRGRARDTPPPSSNAAQTNAVLQTLGYGRYSPSSPFNRLKRLAGYVVVGIILSIAIWAGVVWATQAYLRRKLPAGAFNARGSTPATPVRPTPAPSRRPVAPPPPVPSPPTRAVNPAATPAAPVPGR